MKNKMRDLNNHLFAQLERLADEDLHGDSLDQEINRSKAISGIAKDIAQNARLEIKAREMMWEWSRDKNDLPQIMGGE